MKTLYQQDYLSAAKKEIGLGWDELAVRAGIAPRALKTYRMPNTSNDFRNMPNTAKEAIDRLLQAHRGRAQREYTLCQDRFNKPLVVLKSSLGNGFEIHPERLRKLAAAMILIANEAEKKNMAKGHRASKGSMEY